MARLLTLGVLVSGSGSNLQALIDACQEGILKNKATIAVVISDKPNALALERAKKAGIPTLCLERQSYASTPLFMTALTQALLDHAIDLVCCAGFLKILSDDVLCHYQHRILNIHPALLPKYGGKGMYGHHVHEAVLAAGETESGCTVHFVNEGIDTGEIFLQAKVPIRAGDTPDLLAARVLKKEHELYPQAVLRYYESNHVHSEDRG